MLKIRLNFLIILYTLTFYFFIVFLVLFQDKIKSTHVPRGRKYLKGGGHLSIAGNLLKLVLR
jgi:hypothetical protein